MICDKIQYIDLPLPKLKIRCIMKNTYICSIFKEGAAMRYTEAIVECAYQTSNPLEFISRVLVFASSLQGSAQTQAHAVDLLQKDYP